MPYTYGGCRGTPNLFPSEQDCRAVCPGRLVKDPSAAVCALPMARGRCRGRKVRQVSWCHSSQPLALQPAFAYNRVTNRCEAFLWGGCGGNDNRFHSVEEVGSIGSRI